MPITIDVRPIELEDGKHFVSVTIDGHKMKEHGPFSDATEAEAAADRLMQVSRALMTERR
jgi:hypothetical protein